MWRYKERKRQGTTDGSVRSVTQFSLFLCDECKQSFTVFISFWFSLPLVDGFNCSHFIFNRTEMLWYLGSAVMVTK